MPTTKGNTMNKYIKKPGTPGKTKMVGGKPKGDSGQVNCTAKEMREKRRAEAEARAERSTP